MKSKIWKYIVGGVVICGAAMLAGNVSEAFANTTKDTSGAQAVAGGRVRIHAPARDDYVQEKTNVGLSEDYARPALHQNCNYPDCDCPGCDGSNCDGQGTGGNLGNYHGGRHDYNDARSHNSHRRHGVVN